MPWGTADEVRDRIIAAVDRTGADVVHLRMNTGAMPHDMFMNQIRLFAEKVLPALQAHQVKVVPAAEEVRDRLSPAATVRLVSIAADSYTPVRRSACARPASPVCVPSRARALVHDLFGELAATSPIMRDHILPTPLCFRSSLSECAAMYHELRSGTYWMRRRRSWMLKSTKSATVFSGFHFTSRKSPHRRVSRSIIS